VRGWVEADGFPVGGFGLGVPLGLVQDQAESGMCAGQPGVKRDGRAVGSLGVRGPVLPVRPVSLVGVGRGRGHVRGITGYVHVSSCGIQQRPTESKHGRADNIKSQPG
jgi:hypothetical protein